MMNDTVATCPDCGGELGARQLAGLCPRCLMRRGTETLDEPTLALDPGDDGPEDAPAVVETPGRYTLIGEHARGGMGRVLVVHDEALGRDVALKELLPGPGDDTAATPTPARHSKELTARFLREAKITGQLEHPGITPVHELGRRPDGSPYYTMKLVGGRTLDQAIRTAADFEERRRLLPHFVDLCQAIAYAHSRGVIHRDIKPANVLLGEFGETIVVDWGLAKVVAADRETPDEVDPNAATVFAVDPPQVTVTGETRYGEVLGTPAYMSPEQARGRLDEIDERADVYSLGAVLYQILTGVPPVAGRSVEELIDKVVYETPKAVRSVEPRVPRELALICERAMARGRDERTPSAGALARQVERAVATPEVFVNPLRPFLTDLVPELRRLSRLDKAIVMSEASRRWRRKNLLPSVLQDLALVGAIILFSTMTAVAFFALVGLAHELGVTGWEEALWLGLTVPGIALLVVVTTRAHNRAISPYVREVLLEGAGNGRSVAEPAVARSRRKVATRKIAGTAFVGALVGSYLDILGLPGPGELEWPVALLVALPLAGGVSGAVVESILLARSKRRAA